ncbi:MAG: aa3-type cytochrome c oxidase subunit IV [Enhydrobacter sp.]|nr:MAG: aa3-type cytochrome c oxidase subunit IV [Enhydrobacter sp.]
MATDTTTQEYREHRDTYESFNKLVLFTILWVVLLLCCMALGLVGNLPVISLLFGIGGTLALIVGFAVLS